MEDAPPQPEPASTATQNHPTPSAPAQPQKPINTLLLDSTPLLTNTPPLSTLLSHATTLLSTPSVIAEIRDEAARSRIESLYLPFLTLRTPKPESVKFVRDFARRTGDLGVLSRTDVEVLALAYEVECELNHGDWRLRRVPGQKRTNGAMPGKEEKPEQSAEGEDQVTNEVVKDALPVEPAAPTPRAPWAKAAPEADVAEATEPLAKTTLEDSQPDEERFPESTEVDTTPSLPPQPSEADISHLIAEEEASSSDDSDGWITPSNINKRKAADAAANNTTSKTPGTMQIATITGDFAMQNVLLQMNLNLLSPSTCQRITNLKRTILRCHACFATTKQMERQFCDRCGKPALTRVTCTTNANGETKLHLKAKMQWNNKGNVFSIPKPVHGTANQKYKGPKHGGGGKGGWGSELILAEDQKEYERAKQAQGRERVRDLMDEDYLPGILTGDRNSGAGRVRVGAGRTVNARKRQ
jgi:RNA-binding protein NOB1